MFRHILFLTTIATIATLFGVKGAMAQAAPTKPEQQISEAQSTSADDERFDRLFETWESLDSEASTGELKMPWGDKSPEHKWVGELGFAWIFEKDVFRHAHSVEAWVRESLKIPESDGSSYVLTRYSFDCKSKYQIQAQSIYGSDGVLIREFDDLPEWKFVRPESSVEIYSLAICPLR